MRLLSRPKLAEMANSTTNFNSASYGCNVTIAKSFTNEKINLNASMQNFNHQYFETKESEANTELSNGQLDRNNYSQMMVAVERLILASRAARQSLNNSSLTDVNEVRLFNNKDHPKSAERRPNKSVLIYGRRALNGSSFRMSTPYETQNQQ